MGLTPEFKKFLYSLFPQCFSSELPHNKEFNIIIKEVLPNIVPKIFGITPTTNTTINRLCVKFKEDCYEILCNRPGVRRLILLLDNYNCVPGNKSLTEIKRDKNVSGKGTESKTWLNEEEYLTLRYEKNLRPDDLFIKDEYDNINKIDGQILWRDGNFRWLLHYALSREFSKMFIPEGKELVIDEGIFYSKDELKKLRESILNEHNMNNKFITDYEKDCLFSFEIKNYLKIGYIYPDHKIHLKDSSGIGESDLKILSHINRTITIIPDNNNGEDKEIYDSFLVITPDSDVLAMLLLHMKSLIDPDELTINNEVFMDTQTSFDKAYNSSRETRFININLLFKSIIEFFKQEYKDVIYPVETMIFLFLSYFSDYNEPVSPYLSVGPARLWNSFSLLHYTNKSKGYVTFNQNNIKEQNFKREQNIIKPYEFKGEDLLNNFLSLDAFNNTNLDRVYEFDEYTSEKDQSYFSNYFVARFNEDNLVKFFCYVYQQNLIKKFKEAGILKSNKNILDYNDLLTLSKEYQLKSTPPCPTAKNNNNNNVPEYCGLLSYNDLITRIRSLQWIFNYFQNGWKSDEFCNDYYNCSNVQQTISVHGWTLVKFDPLDKNDNNNFSISSNHVLKFKKPYFNKNLPNSIYTIYDFFTVKRLSTEEDKTDSLLKKLLNI